MKKSPRQMGKLIISLCLSAILFAMPIGAFMANPQNAAPVFASNISADATGESLSSEQEREESGGAEESTVTGSEEESETETEESQEPSCTCISLCAEKREELDCEICMEDYKSCKPLCTCNSKCTELSIDKKCEICVEDYTKCGYLTPNVLITMEPESGWAYRKAKVLITVSDVLETGNLRIKEVDARIGQNGSWVDVTEDMYLNISENCTVYVKVTDKNGHTYEKNRAIQCFDTTKPTLNAAVSDGLLSIQAFDNDSGIKAIYVNGYEFKELTNGVLNIRLQQFDAGYQYFTIQGMDHAGNMSEVYKTPNPYYRDPENTDDNSKDPAKDLPVSAEPSKPSSATGNVTEHVMTDNSGNVVKGNNTSSQNAEKKDSNQKDTGNSGTATTVDTDKGKEFYTIQTQSEKVFYLVIDRDGDNETVYFLTEVDENDLLNTTSDNSEVLPKNSAAIDTAIPTDGSEYLSGSNEGRGEDKNPQGEITGDEENPDTPAEEETAEQEKQVKEKSGRNAYLVMALIGAAVIGGYYFLVLRKKKDDFIDEEDDDNEDIFSDDDIASDREDDFFADDYDDDEENRDDPDTENDEKENEDADDE